MRIKAQDSKVCKPYKMRASHALAICSVGFYYHYCALIENFLKEGAIVFFSRGRGGVGGGVLGAFSCPLVLTPARNTNPAKPLKTKEKPRNFNEVPRLIVEMGGIEPPSNSRPRGLLRAQSASYFSAPGIMQTCYQIGSVD